jgi:CheY-like chemotaxis protein
MKVLILEDDVWFAESLENMLSSSDLIRGSSNKSLDIPVKPEYDELSFDIKIVNSPEKVFDVIEAWWPDVMLADVVLGAKNLFVLLHEMQSYVDTRELPVVILSSISQQIGAANLKNFNVRKVLDKAKITPDVLWQTLREVSIDWIPDQVQNDKKGAIK